LGTDAPMNPDRYLQPLLALLEDFTQDWDRSSDAPITRQTRLFADLGFESIDIIQLIVAMQEEVVQRKLPFDTLLMKEGRYVDDLSVGQIADYLAQHAA
jgi:acyl carrier protein